MNQQNGHATVIILLPLKRPSKVKQGYVVNWWAWIVQMKVTSAISAIIKDSFNEQSGYMKKELVKAEVYFE